MMRPREKRRLLDTQRRNVAQLQNGPRPWHRSLLFNGGWEQRTPNERPKRQISNEGLLFSFPRASQER